jgi:hypothetical protein
VNLWLLQGSSDDTSTECYVNNDAPVPLTGTVVISSINFASGAETVVTTKKVEMAAGVGQTMFFDLGKQVYVTRPRVAAILQPQCTFCGSPPAATLFRV